MPFSLFLLTSLLFQVPAQSRTIPKEDVALLPESCVAYLEVPGISKESWASLLEWVNVQLGTKSSWAPFFSPKLRRSFPLVRSILKGLPRNGMYRRMVDLGSRPFAVGLLRTPMGRMGFFEVFRASSPRMARYTARMLGVPPNLRGSSLGNRVLLSSDQWVLDAFGEAWTRQRLEGTPSARALRIGASLPKVPGLRGYVDLPVFHPPRRGAKKRLNPGGYLFFGSWEELVFGSSALSFGFYREGDGVRGILRLAGVVERMDAPTKAILGVGEPPRLGAAPPPGCALSMAFDRKIPAFLTSFGKLFSQTDSQDLQGFYQQLELFFRGHKAEKLLASLQGPLRLTEFPPRPEAQVLRRGGGSVRFGSAFIEASWVDPKTRAKLPAALQVFGLAANQQRKNRGKRQFLLRKSGDARRGMLRASLKTPLREEEKNLEDLIEPRLAWEGKRVAIGMGGARIWDPLERPPHGADFHEFYTMDGEKLWEVIEGLGPLSQAAIALNNQFPPSVLEKAWPFAKPFFSSLGRLSLGLRWERWDALLSLRWRPAKGEGGAR